MVEETGGRYGSPRRPDFAAPGDHRPSPPSYAPGYPPPAHRPAGVGVGVGQTMVAGPPGPYRPAGSPAPMSRPPMVTLSVVLIITGSLLWMTALGFVWIFVYVARDSFGYAGAEGAIYHMLERFHLRMIEGLAAVLFGAPGIAVVLSFFLLLRRSWPRIAISVLGVLTVAVVAVLLSDSLVWVLPGVAYIAFACLILWTPAVGRWCAAQPAPQQPGPHRPAGTPAR